ncbi:MAG: family hydrolase, diadenosine tetraphosphate hydrolase [Parcubacteria group bacterium]|nr:family hydrolase, diadenosine tetraphosphate hydrolase [Parcubacteria group bacterium]
MEKTIFQKIIDRELPAEILYEDDTVIAILNRFPNIDGETLVISKTPVPYVFNLESETYIHLMEVTRKIAKVLDQTFGTLRTCVVIEGLDVPHVHVRLYPITEPHLNLIQGPEATDEHLKEVGDKIRASLEN